MPVERFGILQPAFGKADLVHLQGWGEPLLHPDIGEMIRIVKESGAKAGTTTNASCLTPDMAKFLVKNGLNVIGFSLAGISRERNDSIRRGSSFDSVIQGVQNLQDAKRQLDSAYPDIHVAYMLLNSNLDELEYLPDFFAKLKVDQVVVSSLSLVCSPELIPESILAETGTEWEALVSRLERIREEAVSKGVDLQFQVVSPYADPGQCEENITRALVVDADGDVSPCVLANVPVSDGCPSYFNGQRLELPKLSFGNIEEEPVGHIWRKTGYRKFRKDFSRRRMPGICQKCYKSRVVRIGPQPTVPGYDMVEGI